MAGIPTSRIPQPMDQGKHSESCMSYILLNYTEHRTLVDDGNLPLMTAKADRYACGFPIPEFQREPCWTRDQKVAFIESAWLELPLGTFTHHTMDWGPGGEATRFSGWLIDGQQRLSAIQAYWDDEFPVFGLHWSELTKPEKRRFKGIKFPRYEADLADEAAIRDLYNRLALGGTPHTPDQRA